MITFPSSALTDSELELRDQVRSFMNEYRNRGHRAQLGINAEASIEFSREVAQLGWIGMSIPIEYGGHGRTAVDRFVVVEEMLAAGAPISAHWVGDRQTAQMLLKFGTEEQKRRFLPAIVSSDVFFCLGMSEPGSGSDLASVRSRATKTDGGWVLNGQKVWTSGAQYADFAVTLCRTEPLAERKHVGLSQLIVDLKAKGVTVVPIRLLNGAHHFNEVFFDEVFIPDEMLLGRAGDGWHQVTSELAHERSGPDRFLSVMPIVQLLYDRFKDASLDRQVRSELGALFAHYVTFRTMSLSIARRLDSGELPAVEAALVKDMGTQFENDAISAVRRIIGRQIDPFAGELEALLADAIVTAPTFTLRGGTNEVLRTVIAKDLIRQPDTTRTTNFNNDLFSVLDAVFEKHDQQTIFHPVEPWADDLWSQLYDGGFTTIGADATLADHAAIAKAVGKHSIALPLSDVGLARWAADRAELALPDEAVVVCAGLDEQDRIDATLLKTGRVRLDGVAHRVPWGRHATVVLLPVTVGGQDRWLAVDRDQLEVRESVNFANEPRDDLRFVGVESNRIGIAGARPQEVVARGALLRTLAAVGAMEFVLDASLVHAEQRQQFGRPISDFQAVQQHLVLIAEAVASVSAAADAAVHCAPEIRLMMVAAAKSVLGEQAAILTRLAHQVHGAIGATDEHPIQSRTRRLWSWQDEFGTSANWAVDLAEKLIFPESPGAWPVLTPPLAELTARDVGERVPW